MLRFADRLLTLLSLCLNLGPELESLILGFDFCLSLDGLCLPLGIVDDVLGFLLPAFQGTVCDVAGDYETKGDADDTDEYRNDDIGHRSPFRLTLNNNMPWHDAMA